MCRVFETAVCWQQQSSDLFTNILNSATDIKRLSSNEEALSKQLQAALACISAISRQLAQLKCSYDGVRRTQELEQQLLNAHNDAARSIACEYPSFVACRAPIRVAINAGLPNTHLFVQPNLKIQRPISYIHTSIGIDALGGIVPSCVMPCMCVCCADVGELRAQISEQQQDAAAVSEKLQNQQQHSDWESAQHTAKELHSVHEAMQEIEQQVDAANGAGQLLLELPVRSCSECTSFGCGEMSE